MSIGHRIRNDRKRAGLTLRELASKVDYDFTYLSKIENGTVDENGKPFVPSDELIERIAKVLGVNPDEYRMEAHKPPSGVGRWTSQKAFQEFYRTRGSKEISDEEWRQLTEYLKRLRNKGAHPEEGSE